MRRRIIHDISASSLQVMISQMAGLILFFVTSASLSKAVFGQLNWALAVLLVGFAILGSGIDQVTVRRIAAGEEAAGFLRIYIFHVLVTGLLFLVALLMVCMLTHWHLSRWRLLFFLGIGQFFTFLSLPFKQIANGKEQFRTLLGMSVGANLIKVFGIIALAVLHRITTRSFVTLYVLAALAEWLVGLYSCRRFLRLTPGLTWDRKRYVALIRESLPQLGVILCTAGIARFDWIWLGIVSTAPVLAEYSFAYRAFELSGLPLLILAPLLLPRMTRWFTGSARPDSDRETQIPGGTSETPALFDGRRREDVLFMIRMEMVLACGCCLLLNIVWSPLIDKLTGGRYGAVNSINFLLLSLALPLQYLNNMLWSLLFALGRLRYIFFVFLLTLLVIVTGDLVLIPIWLGRGAALAYLIAMLLQTIRFIQGAGSAGLIRGTGRLLQPLLICGISALLTGWIVSRLDLGTLLQSLIATVGYLVLLFACGQFRIRDLITGKRLIYA